MYPWLHEPLCAQSLAARWKWIMEEWMGLSEPDTALMTFDLGKVEVILCAP